MSNNDYKENIELEIEEIVEVVEKYEGGTTADITVNVDNDKNIITATLNTSGSDSFPTLETLISDLNSKTNDQYKIGTELFVEASGVPDFWVYAVSDNFVSYNFTTQEALVEEIRTNGHVQVGYYLLAINETDLSNYVSKPEFKNMLANTLPELGESKNKLFMEFGEVLDQITASVDTAQQILTLNGSPNSANNKKIVSIKPLTCKAGETWTFTRFIVGGEGNLGTVKLINEAEGTWSDVQFNTTTNIVTITFVEDKTYNAIACGWNPEGTLVDYQLKFQAEYGNESTEWELPTLGDKVVFDSQFKSYISEADSKLSNVESIAKGAQQAVSFENYNSLINSFNTLSNDIYKIGQNILIVTLNVPDLWISEVLGESVTYTYTSDADLVDTINNNGYVQIGYYKLSALETGKVNIENMVTTDTEQTITGTKTFSSPSISDSTINCPSLFWGGSLKIGNSINKPNAHGILIGNNLSLGSSATGNGNVLIGYDLKTQSSKTAYNVLIGYNMDGSENYTCQGKSCVVIGHHAQTGVGDNMIQLGTGTNSNPNTFQVFEYQLLDANGKIPVERLPESSGSSGSTKLYRHLCEFVNNQDDYDIRIALNIYSTEDTFNINLINNKTFACTGFITNQTDANNKFFCVPTTIEFQDVTSFNPEGNWLTFSNIWISYYSTKDFSTGSFSRYGGSLFVVNSFEV